MTTSFQPLSFGLSRVRLGVSVCQAEWGLSCQSLDSVTSLLSIVSVLFSYIALSPDKVTIIPEHKLGCVDESLIPHLTGEAPRSCPQDAHTPYPRREVVRYGWLAGCHPGPSA